MNNETEQAIVYAVGLCTLLFMANAAIYGLMNAIDDKPYEIMCSVWNWIVNL